MTYTIEHLTNSGRLGSMFVDGLWSAPLSPAWIPVINPATEETVAIANDSEYGLAAHIQGRGPGLLRQVATRLRCGQVHINHPPWPPHAPFGGYKHSGNGREYGIEGLEEYLETKAVLGLN